MAYTILRKITAKTVLGVEAIDRDLVVKYMEENQGDGRIFAVLGISRAVQGGSSQFGAWFQFLGEFVARRPNGLEMRSGACHLPEPAEGMLLDAMGLTAAGVPTEKESPPVQGHASKFAYVVGFRLNSSKIGFEYYVENLRKQEVSSEMSSLIEESGMGAVFTPALPAPKEQ